MTRRIVAGWVCGLVATTLLMAAVHLTRAADPPAAAAPPKDPAAAAEDKDAADAAKKEATEEEKQLALASDVTQGALRIVKPDATVVECPLEHTDVQAEISGFLARVHVTQTFHNPTDEKIEAVYVFPLPHEAAIDGMTMLIGGRKIVGLIKRRAEARLIYEEAMAAGQAAALLEQERPNIFTQSVANIPPKGTVKIEIQYIDPLKYDLGTYQFHFPMVVGPRYNPGGAIASPAERPAELIGKVSPPDADTTQVPDASKINPPVLRPEFRTGHDISLSVTLDAGVPIQDLAVSNHQTNIDRDGDRQAKIELDPADSLPNKDFVLRYKVVGKKPEMAVLAHTGDPRGDAGRLGEGYFLLMIQPQEDERLTQSPPREIVFLIDVSGSMSGAPTDKVIDAMQSMLKLCRENDTVQVVTFASQANKLFDKPVPVNENNIERALHFTSGIRGGGGTEMLRGVQLAIDEPIDAERVRIVVMLTDGYIGNEAAIIEHVGKNCGDQIRFWAIGIGSSPNMFLIDGVAKQGGGMGKQLGLSDDTTALTQEVMTRIQRAQLANLSIDWGNLEVAETYPRRLPELWAGRPVMVYGRYAGGGGTTQIKVSGKIEGKPAEWPLTVTLPKEEPGHDVLANVWARQKIEDLMQQTYYLGSPAVEEEVTALALQYGLMSQYTSFVAVDAADSSTSSEPAQPPRRMLVPVPLPEGTRWEGFFGERGESDRDAFAGRLDLRGATAGAFHFGIVGDGLRRAEEKSHPSGGYSGPIPSLHRPMERIVERSLRSTSDSLKNMHYRGSNDMLRSRSANGRQQALQLSNGLATSRFGRMPTPDSASVAAAAAAPKPMSAPAFKRLSQTSPGGKTEDYEMPADEAVFRPIVAGGDEMLKQAQSLLKNAEDQRQAGQLAAARASYREAYLRAVGAANAGHWTQEFEQAALAGMDAVRQKQLEAWTKSQPALQKRLDLVIKDSSLSAAVAQLAKAAGCPVTLIPGSDADAVELVGRRQAHVEYLDLRGATLAEALDWLLFAVRLDWRVDGESIIAGSPRRDAGTSAWVYDVTAIALPLSDELGKADEAGAGEKRAQAAKKLADEFVKALRDTMQIDGDQNLNWIAPGQLLLVGTADQHTALTSFIHMLSLPKGQLPETLVALHAKTSKRAAARKEMLAKLQSVDACYDVAAALDAYGWQLLAAAAEGRVDDEALTSLSIAWRDPEMKPLCQGDAAAVALRSLWQLESAARAVPASEALQALVGQARTLTAGCAKESIDALSAKPEDLAPYATVFYAALTTRDDAERKAALAAIDTAVAKKPDLANSRRLLVMLVGTPSAEDETEFASFLSKQVSGPDTAVLAAVAARRLGGSAWQTFRSETIEQLADQPLPGEVVVLVNRLGELGCPLVRTAE